MDCLSWADWRIGITVGLIGGWAVVWAFQRLSPPPPPMAKGGVPPWLTGLIERGFFTPVAAIGFARPESIGFVVTAMLAWLTLKMAANWGRPTHEAATPRYMRFRAQHSVKALLSGLISMGFALLGGAICAGIIPVHSFVCP